MAEEAEANRWGPMGEGMGEAQAAAFLNKSVKKL
jgi:hypothetical protein